MKRILFLSLLVVNAVYVFGQTEPEPGKLKLQNQIGVDATNFIKSFLSFSNVAPVTTANVPVFMVNYKALFYNRFLPAKFKYGVRLGVSTLNSEKDESTETTHDNTKSNSNAFRGGLELQ